MDRRRFFKLSSLAALAAAVPSSARAGMKLFTGSEKEGRRCRVTVVRRECFSDLQSRFLDEPESGPCPVFATGQQFEVSADDMERLVAEGKFCPKAWKCISSHIDDVLADKTMCDTRPESGNSHVAIACCNDGTRPVVFKIEAI